MQFLSSLSRLIVAVIAATDLCGACSIVFAPVQVGPNFRVKVEDEGRPVRGVRLKIRGNLKDSAGAMSETGDNGVAWFRSVQPGSYHLSAGSKSDAWGGTHVEVKPGEPNNITVPMNWPASIRIRSLRGVIHGPDEFRGQHLSLDLLEGNSGRLLKSVQTADGGGFSFGDMAPGRYFLSLMPSGLIAVTVDGGAETESLDIDFGLTSCGLWYRDRSQCPQSDLRIAEFSGRVEDDSGSAIRSATILLLDHTGTMVERLYSDSVGHFESQHALAGTYELVVSSTGFTPFRRTVRAESGDTARRSTLTVRLGVGGSCSAGFSR